MRRLRPALTGTAVVAAGVVALLPAAPAGAAPAADTADMAAPVVTAEPLLRYVVGGAVETGYNSPEDVRAGRSAYWGIDALAVKWRTTDPSGICAQTLTERSYETLGGEPDPVLGTDTVSSKLPRGARTATVRTNQANETRVTGGWIVRASDCAGNTGRSSVVRASVGLVEDVSPKVTYTGTWRTARFAGFSGGTTHSSVVAGAQARVAVPGGPVGLVMETAPDRGAADVLVDGSKVATIDTFAAETAHRTVVWQGVLPAGSHTVTVVNRATAGRPRVDLDLVLTRAP